MKHLLIAAAALVPLSSASAQTVAIINARLETLSSQGTIAKGTLVLQNGKILAVGAGVEAPAGAVILDAKGGVVTPGLIAASSNLTVSEIDAVSETRDDRSGKLSAGFDIQYGVNPGSALIPHARQSGLTRAVATPVLSRGGGGHVHDDSGAGDFAGGGGGGEGDPPLFAGQAAIVSLASGQSDLVLGAKVAVALDLGQAGAAAAGGSRGASLVLVRAALEDARAFARNRSDYDEGDSREFGLSRIDLEALVPVIQGKTPLLIRVSRASDIRQALRLAREEKLKIILEGAEEGWMVASEIAAAGVGVLMDPQANLPTSFETLGSRLDNAARLQARFNAGTAVAYGLPYQAALASVTLNPAKIWGIADRVGSLEKGKDADVVLWSGDPLETSSWPVAVFIGGVRQPDSSRAFELRDRYAAPLSAYPQAYVYERP